MPRIPLESETRPVNIFVTAYHQMVTNVGWSWWITWVLCFVVFGLWLGLGYERWTFLVGVWFGFTFGTLALYLTELWIVWRGRDKSPKDA